jgi:hypothetical protein
MKSVAEFQLVLEEAQALTSKQALTLGLRNHHNRGG